jgi:alpha-D-ribose 1-methylphosphonate 5-triphosphate synthase subunit PhnH
MFRVVLDALANPGTVRHGIVHPLVAQEFPQGNRFLASVLMTLLDHEVSLHVTPGPEAAALADLVVRRTRTTLADARDATFVAAEATKVDPDLPTEMERGSLEYPDDGATLLLDVPSLDQETSGALSLELTGPGIRTAQVVRLSDVAPELIASRNRAVAHYPMGIDLLLIDRFGRIVGLPRSTSVVVHTEGGS